MRLFTSHSPVCAACMSQHSHDCSYNRACLYLHFFLRSLHLAEGGGTHNPCAIAQQETCVSTCVICVCEAAGHKGAEGLLENDGGITQAC